MQKTHIIAQYIDHDLTPLAVANFYYSHRSYMTPQRSQIQRSTAL